MLRPLLILLLLAAAGADEVELRDGTILGGEIVAADATTVRLRIQGEGMAAERSIPAAEVARIVRGPSRRQQALARLREDAGRLTADDAAGWAAIAQRARTAGDAALARTWAERAVAIDRHQAEAQRLLGREPVAGIWMRATEAATQRGLLWHDGRWITWPEQQERERQERERQERQRAALAAAGARRSRAAAEPAWPASYRLTADTPLNVIWWGGMPATPPACWRRPGSNLRLDGGWGGVRWKIDWEW